MRITGLMGIMAVFGLAVLGNEAAMAAAGQPEPWQLGFQDAVTPMMREITWFHNLLLWIIFPIAIFVMLLLVWVMLKYNQKANPVPAQFSHNTLIEVIWTVIPILILVAIAVPSLRILYANDTVPEADMTIKATGYQWYWGYEYPDHFPEEEFIANMLEEDELGLDPYGDPQPRLLATDFTVVVPVGKVVRVLVAGADVIHNWAMPSFGVKMDAVPGRVNETWFKAEQEGMFYGQCSELCGIKHAFMPIAVQVVSEREFERWVAEQQQELGLADAGTEATQVAAVAAE